jgi:hypothetical protein
MFVKSFMKNSTLYLIIFLCVGAIVGLSFESIRMADQLHQTKKDLSIQTKKADSLDAELFPVQIELGRYQVAYEIFMERNPKGAHQYGTIISEETE